MIFASLQFSPINEEQFHNSFYIWNYMAML